MTKILCKHCHLPEEDHHEFEPEMPEGCQCDEGDWCGDVKPICEEYIQWDKYPDENVCERCEHPKECHAKNN